MNNKKIEAVTIPYDAFNQVAAMIQELPFRMAQPILRVLEKNHTIVYEAEAEEGDPSDDDV